MTSKKGIFEFWNKKRKQNFSSYFSFVLALKTKDAQMLFLLALLKSHKRIVINCHKRLKWHFWRSITFVSKLPTKRTFVRHCFKAESKPKHKDNFLGGFSSKTKKELFGGPKWYFFKVKFQICNSVFVL